MPGEREDGLSTATSSLGSSTGTAVLDRDGRVVDLDEVAREILGCESERVGGRPYLDLLPPEFRAAVGQAISRVLGGRGRRALERVGSDGSVLAWTICELAPEVWARGQVLVCVHDHTELHEALASFAKDLRASEKRYRDLVETSGDLIWSVDAEGRWLFVNRDATRRIYGYEPEEMIGRPFTDFMTREQAAKDVEIFNRIKTGEPRFRYKTEHLRKDGSIVHLRFNAIVHRNADGNVTGTTGTAADISELIAAEKERREIEAQIGDAQKTESLAMLAGGVAHDFNNLLVGILGGAELALRELSEDSPANDSLHTIRESAIRASELSKQMLAYSGKGQFLLEDVNVSELVGNTARLLRASVSKKADLKLRLLKDLPAVYVDVTQVRQVAMNLIANASDAIGAASGTIAVSTGAMECDGELLKDAVVRGKGGPGTYVYFEVSDTGCGMDDETRRRMFDPFFSTKFVGRGLGLAAVLGIVRGHRGAIFVSSQPGEGATIRVLFPAVERSVAVRPAQAPASVVRPGAGTVVLVADDDHVVRRVTSVMLTKAGYRVVTARDGQDAVEVFGKRRDEVGVILLDMTMPRMSGDEALQKIREMSRDIPVILTSGYNEQDAIERFDVHDFTAFIQKPFGSRELLSTLQDALA